MDSGQIDFYQHDTVCSNTCRSTKFDVLINSTRLPPGTLVQPSPSCLALDPLGGQVPPLTGRFQLAFTVSCFSSHICFGCCFVFYHWDDADRNFLCHLVIFHCICSDEWTIVTLKGNKELGTESMNGHLPSTMHHSPYWSATAQRKYTNLGKNKWISLAAFPLPTHLQW